MNPELIVPILIFPGLFFLLQRFLSLTATPVIKYLLNGPLRQLSVSYFEDVAKVKMDTAFRQQNPAKAWEEITLAKVREMGHSRTSYEKRRENLDYIKSATLNKRVIEGLIEIMPFQHNLGFQQELVCFVCEVLSNFDKKSNGNHVDPRAITSSLQAPLMAWNDLLAAWLAGAATFAIIWENLDKYPLMILVLLCTLIFFSCFIQS